MKPLLRYERAARQAQSGGRIPALSVALVRHDREPWAFTVGGPASLGPDTRFRIGSVTKTFTAVLVMQARDDGLLDLDRPIADYLDVPAHGDATARRLLSHTAGFQREPYGDIWDTLVSPGADELIAQLDRAERVLPTARRYHYSNLAYAVLGRLVAQVRGGTWEEILAARILHPLGLTSTTPARPSSAAVGYLVDAYSDAVRPEPDLDLGGAGPAARLWSTATDMARWGAFLASPSSVDPDGAVLPAATVLEMRWPVTPTAEDLWETGFGLGLMLHPQGGRVVHVGHDGAMPGFLAGVYGRVPDGIGCAVLGSSGTAREINDLAHELLTLSASLDPFDIGVWSPGPSAPAAYRSVLGPWWGEGCQHVFSWHGGRLRALPCDAPDGFPPSVFEPLPDRPDVLRTVAGRETGELLRLTRDDSGSVVRMHWATYRFTRVRETFDGAVF